MLTLILKALSLRDKWQQARQGFVNVLYLTFRGTLTEKYSTVN